MPAPNPRFRLYTRPASYTSLIGDTLRRRTTQGDAVERLESALARFVGSPHAVAMPMARVGIHLALKHLLGNKRQVILSPYTIADVINMVIAAGGIPVFGDVDRQTCNLSPSEVGRLIGPETGAVLVTHLHGISAATYDIRDLCHRHGVPLVEDAAQAFGAIQQGQRLGTIGDAGIYSFGMYKNVNAWYGGAVVTGREDLALALRREIEQWPFQRPSFVLKRMRKGLLTDLLTHPLLFKALTFWIFRYGFLHDVEWINRKVRTELDTNRYDALPGHYGRRLTPTQAELILKQLDDTDRLTQERIERGALYHELLQDVPGLITPPTPDGIANIYSYFPVQCGERDTVLKGLMRHNRDVAAQHLKNCADLDSFREYYRDCPNARQAAREVILLPTYPQYPMEDVRRTALALRNSVPAAAVSTVAADSGKPETAEVR